MTQPRLFGSVRIDSRLIAVGVVACLAALGGCSSEAGYPAGAHAGTPSETATPSSAPETEPAVPLRIKTVPSAGSAAVPVDQLISVVASGGTIRSVRVVAPTGPIPGELSTDATRWHATERLEPGQTYQVTTIAQDSAGEKQTRRSSFRTVPLTLAEQTYPSVAPLNGETVGVGMPVIVNFDVPVTDKRAFEKNLHISSTPRQRGAWHWISDTEVHWRPAKYWQAGTDVTVDVDVNGVSAGNGIYGQEDRKVTFHVGAANIYRVNAQTHQMRVFSNGQLLRTLPITTGKPGFTTRSGVKVIIEKFRSKRMNSETVGIDADDPEAYDIDNVEYAMRVTYSGEFIHAAPWSVGSQGYANVSHGCTGMSTSNAAWLYAMSKRGDVVEYTGTDVPMTLTNGYGDWNAPFRQYAEGSALN